MTSGRERQVLITGSSSGFGLLTAIEFASRGWRVHASMRNLGKRGALDRAAADAGLRDLIEVCHLDVCDLASIAERVETIIADVGGIDVLVNNAGYGIGGFFEDLSMQELRDQFETNFFGVAAMMQAVLPHMRERGSGRIINVSSLAGRMGQPSVSAYVASKWAVEGLSESVRLEMLPRGVFVSLVEPGSFRTETFDSNMKLAAAASHGDSPYRVQSEHMLAMVQKQIANSKADPRRVARTIVRAATARRPRARYLVGIDAKTLPRARAVLPMRLFERLVVRAVRPPGGYAPAP